MADIGGDWVRQRRRRRFGQVGDASVVALTELFQLLLLLMYLAEEVLLLKYVVFVVEMLRVLAATRVAVAVESSRGIPLVSVLAEHLLGCTLLSSSSSFYFFGF